MAPIHVLVIDDDRDMCELLAAGLTGRGFRVTWTRTAVEALDAFTTDDVDVVLTDLRMPGMNGLDLCAHIVADRPEVPVLILTAAGNLESAVAAIRAGAHDFIVKPPDLDALALALGRASEHRRLRSEVERLRRVVEGSHGFEELLGTSPPMRKLYDLLARLADSDASILITGESGTGKELAARALHRSGHRRAGPFVVVNCAAMPDALLESEIFGHVRGAFTDARVARTGLFQQASEGTLFLDELGELPLPLQPKLLRALQERAVRPLGADAEIPCDVRIIAATNRDIEAAVAGGGFREDLYFRVNVLRVDMPPLRARADDVLLLAQRFVDRYAAKAGRVAGGLSPAVAKRLLAHPWPGNVRELQNCIEHAVAVARAQQITVSDLPESLRSFQRTGGAAGDGAGALMPLEQVERSHIARVLDAVEGNKTRAAEILGLDRKTLHRKLARYAGSEAPTK